MTRSATAALQRASADLSGLGQTIRAARDECGITRAELARRLGVADEQLRRWECGDHLPRRETLAAIVAALSG